MRYANKKEIEKITNQFLVFRLLQLDYLKTSP